MVDTLEYRDREDNAVARFPEQADLLGHDTATVNDNPCPDAGQLMRDRPGAGEDVILLGQPIAGVHDAIGDITIVREEQQALGVAVQPANRKDALGDIDQIHDRPAATLVVHRRDVATRLVQDQVAERLRREQLAVHADIVTNRISPGAKLGHDRAVDGDAALANQFFSCSPGRDAARRKDALQSFQPELLGGVGVLAEYERALVNQVRPREE